jgi:hypothetical protein
MSKSTVEQIKKPLTAFFMYRAEVYDSVKTANPTAKTT